MANEPYCIVGFVAAFPDQPPSSGEATGRQLADYIARALSDAGFSPGEPVDVQYAWELRPTIDGATVRTLLGHVDDLHADPPRQWLITNTLDIGFFDRVFRPRVAEAKRNALRRLSRSLHEALAADARFSVIRWYRPSTFDRPGDIERETPE